MSPRMTSDTVAVALLVACSLTLCGYANASCDQCCATGQCGMAYGTGAGQCCGKNPDGTNVCCPQSLYAKCSITANTGLIACDQATAGDCGDCCSTGNCVGAYKGGQGMCCGVSKGKPSCCPAGVSQCQKTTDPFKPYQCVAVVKGDCNDCCKTGNCATAYLGQQGQCCGLYFGRPYCCKSFDKNVCLKNPTDPNNAYLCQDVEPQDCNSCCWSGKCGKAYNGGHGQCCGVSAGLPHCCAAGAECVYTSNIFEPYACQAPTMGTCNDCCTKGVCNRAYNNGPGTCCGSHSGRNFCCPSTVYPKCKANTNRYDAISYYTCHMNDGSKDNNNGAIEGGVGAGVGGLILLAIIACCVVCCICKAKRGGGISVSTNSYKTIDHNNTYNPPAVMAESEPMQKQQYPQHPHYQQHQQYPQQPQLTACDKSVRSTGQIYKAAQGAAPIVFDADN